MNESLPIRAFVIDDEALARKKIIRFLSQDSGVAVVGEASNGAEGVCGIEQTKPDLLFLDVQMPLMDGFAVANALEGIIYLMPRLKFCGQKFS